MYTHVYEGAFRGQKRHMISGVGVTSAHEVPAVGTWNELCEGSCTINHEALSLTQKNIHTCKNVCAHLCETGSHVA